MKIQDITVRKIFDSRGEPTIEVSLKLGNRWFSASVPSGKSRGSKEARVFSFVEAVRALARIRRVILKKEFSSIRALDNALIRLDNTKNKSRLGGNLMLGISIAFVRALAVFANVINGGAHADNNLDIQEYMVVARGGSVRARVENLIDFYNRLGAILRKKNSGRRVPVGDEGGYSLDFKNNFEPIAVLENLVRVRGLAKNFSLALDAAATGFYARGLYAFGGKKLTSARLAGEYARYFGKSKLLFSIEDPFAEKDAAGFSLIHKKMPGAWVVGDDLTVTNSSEIKKYAEQNAINAVIIKPNQIGTVSEAADAILAAKQCGLKTIISHRSGETEDAFIIHLAKASGADGVKIGAPTRERMIKYNELMRLYPVTKISTAAVGSLGY
ncbi:MAG: Enolase [Candidatus Adlerbacteria bacterium GW2011_GWC1_50_9]|uniref:Enolase n=1 Tax=Candidatus Adlerbacteria bacterium GW2011_GWC1_50_9 TaxID=1618608 RepID=A0A0G1ZP19_9BACT|nr:MAG: Enolase [Candidatus Adlerbacteria bacterium GW2011_GWC1_50_9]